jgi:hypothetical protein
MSNNKQPRFLTPAQLVERWEGAVTTGTLANWRSQEPPRGPSFQKFGSRVRYPIEAVEKYERANNRKSFEDIMLEGMNDNKDGGASSAAA